MSKKTRKKSSNTTGRRAATKVARTARTSTGTSAAKTRTAVAKTKGKTAAAVRSKASHKADSKPLKSKPVAAATKAPGVTTPGAILAEGAKAPAFNLPRDGGGSVALKDFTGKKLVLFFYPRADTPGCTREAIDFTRLSGAFADAGTVVLGISADTVKAQESFRNKHQLSVPLVSDEQHQMLEAYGAWGEKSMYGRTFMGIIRTTVLVDSNGKVARIWRNVKVDGHADQVLEAARAL
ncbi:peroxiredoxin [Bradyrhizobium sp. ISRA443]|uniref:peroxiredoxin n=1 Tax=unclassified Bradyrhizobium TaxID=2631580 RepID=UPI002479107E|nr:MULTISPECIES: peroxiredoxin [unclassified Bradyrhizobium]WGS02704.1 peroxiredoxin [Bradyrhizobium sp. ISRA436]WGS09592.1 peroxiredoxin [Bradyrhizobium sp. ISRA437]WGS16475.1 peroxiredoxin [Bradyrhizobium sp. ISRA443]